MAFKLQRNYEMRIEYTEKGVTRFQVITMPQTVEFTISRNSLLSLNDATFKVYNLEPQTRSRIRHDEWDNGNRSEIIFNAGYGDKLFTAFKGVIISAQSYRSGSDFITEIVALDGGGEVVQNVISETFRKGEAKQVLVDKLVESFKPYGVTRGAIAPVEGEFLKNETKTGSPLSLLNTVTGGGCYIDQMRIFCLKPFQYIRSSIAELNSSTGLLETPRVGNQQVEATMLFEPSILVSQQIRLNSREASPSVLNFQQEYRVFGLYHNGIISGAANGACTTTVVLTVFSSIEGKQEVRADG